MTDTNEDEPCSWPTGNCSFSEQITQLQVDNHELWREVRVLQDSNNKSMETITQLNVELYEMREVVEDLMAADDYWLRGNKDNQWASMMASARAKARVALGKNRQ